MSATAAEVTQRYVANLQYVERLIYDVLAYTLKEFGLRKTNIPTTADSKANIYKESNLMKEANASVLFTSLKLRYIIRRVLTWHIECLRFRNEQLPEFCENFLKCILGVNLDPAIKHTVVVPSIALCNEIILFFHNKPTIDIKNLVKSLSKFIVNTIGPDQDISEIVGELFMEFDDLQKFLNWITDFIAKFAVPYGRKEYTQEQFEKDFSQRWEAQFVGTKSPEWKAKITIKARSKKEALPSGPVDSNPIEMKKLSDSSASGVQEKRKSHERRSSRPTNVSYQRAKAARIAAKSKKDEAGQVNPGNEAASQENSGTIQKQNLGPITHVAFKLPSNFVLFGTPTGDPNLQETPETIQKKLLESFFDKPMLETLSKIPTPSKVFIKRGDLQLGRNSPGNHDSPKSPKSPESSESMDMRQRKSTERCAAQLKQETDLSGQSTKNSSDRGIEDGLQQMSLEDGLVSEAKHGAIPKRKTRNKKSKKSRKK